jgi:hypothetical protein
MNKLVRVFVNGCWDVSHEDKLGDSAVIIYDKGVCYEMLESNYDKFIDGLEEKGFDCYLSPEMYSHPQWNGQIIYE